MSRLSVPGGSGGRGGLTRLCSDRVLGGVEGVCFLLPKGTGMSQNDLHPDAPGVLLPARDLVLQPDERTLTGQLD